MKYCSSEIEQSRWGIKRKVCNSWDASHFRQTWTSSKFYWRKHLRQKFQIFFRVSSFHAKDSAGAFKSNKIPCHVLRRAEWICVPETKFITNVTEQEILEGEH